jgi:hypothetical protein
MIGEISSIVSPSSWVSTAGNLILNIVTKALFGSYEGEGRW